MVAAIVSKTIGEIRRGSIPLTDTNFILVGAENPSALAGG